jgi:hypothetical protein
MVVCCSSPDRSGGVITLPVKVPTVFTSNPSATFSPLALSLASLPQKAETSRLYMTKAIRVREMSNFRFIARILKIVASKDYRACGELLHHFGSFKSHSGGTKSTQSEMGAVSYAPISNKFTEVRKDYNPIIAS